MILSLLFRDKPTAKLLNLIDGGQEYDFYALIADEVEKLIGADSRFQNGDALFTKMPNPRLIKVKYKGNRDEIKEKLKSRLKLE